MSLHHLLLLSTFSTGEKIIKKDKENLNFLFVLLSSSQVQPLNPPITNWFLASVIYKLIRWRERKRCSHLGRTRKTGARCFTPPLSPTPWSTSDPFSLVISFFHFWGRYYILQHKLSEHFISFSLYIFFNYLIVYAVQSAWSQQQHVLIIPRREVKRFTDLTNDEICDMWTTARLVGSRLEKYHDATSLTLNIQDGPEAGQSVPHVHIHVVPRKLGDFERNDDIYDALDVKDKELKEKLDLDKERKDRSFEEMTREADIYRSLFV
ncbi:hypothetical protein LUZ61_007980 [Rhynchospora tenuis]|uniref:HIT domain-containing protein n=1 Tax=Rhynchospora tenuis TaxID=198213 RepID=A0AAD6EX67_9POAL|nr:hypothetical protein LUZ61_007980 [Rhynchospora tenuis]